MFDKYTRNPYENEMQLHNNPKMVFEVRVGDVIDGISRYGTAKTKFVGIDKGRTMATKRKYRLLEDNVKKTQKYMCNTIAQYINQGNSVSLLAKVIKAEKQAYEEDLKAHPEQFKIFLRMQACDEAITYLRDLKKSKTK